jgi:hypothetical protein
MAQHFVRGIDETLFRRVKSRAALEGLTMKQAIIRLFQMYADGLKLTKEKK